MISSAKKIAFYYLIIGITWIYLSDKALNYFFHYKDLHETYWNGTIKGILFVIVTSILLYQLIRKYFLALTKSERDYRSMFDANPNRMWIYDLHTLKFIEVNKAAITHYGYTRQEFLSKTVLEIRPDEEKDRFLKETSTIIKKTSYKEPWIHILKNGQQIKVNIHAHEISYKGKMARLVLAVDISEQLEIKEKLGKQQEKLRAQNIKLLRSLETIEIHKNKLFNTQKIAQIAGWEFNIETETLEPSTGFFELLNIHNLENVSPVNILKNSVIKEDQNKLEHFLRSFKMGFTINECTIRFKKGDGLKYVLFAGSLKDPKKQKNYVEGYIKDVTEITLKDQLISKTLERFEQLALSTNDALYEWDLKNSVIRLNGNIDSIMGYGVKEAIHPEKWWVDRMHPIDFRENDKLFREAVEQKQQTLKRKYRFKTLNGAYKLIYDQSIIKYNNNELEKVIGSIQDVDEITKINQENKRLLDIISKVNNFIIITDVNGLIDWVNPAFTELTEYTLEEVKGKKPGPLLQGPESNKEVIMRMSLALKEKKYFSEEIINYSKSGKKYWLKIDCNPIYDDHNQHVGFIAIESEITERKVKEAKIEKQNEILKKTAWFNSHEVRKPLASILGIIELLKYENSEATKKQLISLLEKCSEELDSAIKNAISLTEFKEDQPIN